MLIPNLKVTVDEVTMNMVAVSTEQGERIDLPRHLLPDVNRGTELFLAIDIKPLVSSDQRAKDIVNEILNGNGNNGNGGNGT